MIKWGILGAGRIAPRFIAGLVPNVDCRLVAASCRNPEKGEAFSKTYGVERIYTDADDLIADPAVDAIYLSLPHRFHCEWAVKALRAGKAVLCEKPVVVNAAEMQRIIDAANDSDVLFMEAMKTRFVPMYVEIKRLVDSGIIGEVTAVETSLCNDIPDKYFDATYLTDPLNGGIVRDVGIYCACWLEDFLRGAPTAVSVVGDSRDGVNRYCDALLAFEGGTTGRLECAGDRGKPRIAVLRGTRGYIEVDELHRSQKARFCIDNQEPYTLEMPYEHNDFYSQIRAFADCFNAKQSECAVMPLAASMRCVQILDAIVAGLENGEQN